MASAVHHHVPWSVSPAPIPPPRMATMFLERRAIINGTVTVLCIVDRPHVPSHDVACPVLRRFVGVSSQEEEVGGIPATKR